MTDYSDLVNALRDHEGWVWHKTTLEAADAIEELQQAVEHYKGCADDWYKEACDYKAIVPKWIPVTEKLPDVFKHVLVNIPGMNPHPTVQEAFREKNGMWYSNGFRYGADEITHWQPLPEPPKGGNMTTCVLLDCPFICYCKEYDYTVDRGERCEHMEQIIRKATRFDKQRKKSPKEETE